MILGPGDLDEAIDTLPSREAVDSLQPLRERLRLLVSIEPSRGEEARGLETALAVLGACRTIRLDGHQAAELVAGR